LFVTVKQKALNKLYKNCHYYICYLTCTCVIRIRIRVDLTLKLLPKYFLSLNANHKTDVGKYILLTNSSLEITKEKEQKD